MAIKEILDTVAKLILLVTVITVSSLGLAFFTTGLSESYLQYGIEFLIFFAIVILIVWALWRVK